MGAKDVRRKGRLVITCDYEIVDDGFAASGVSGEGIATWLATLTDSDAPYRLSGWAVCSDPEVTRPAEAVLDAGPVTFGGHVRGDTELNGTPPRLVPVGNYRLTWTYGHWIVMEHGVGQTWEEGDLLRFAELPGLFLMLEENDNVVTGRPVALLERLEA